MTLKAIIFDVDGTLAETEKDGHRVAFNLAFEKFSLPWHWGIELYGELLDIGGGKERIKYYLEKYQPSFIASEGMDSFILTLHQAKSEYYRQLLLTNAIPLRIGVKTLITSARQHNIKLAIASTASVENVKALLDVAFGDEIGGWFEVIVAGDMVKKKKPASDIYQLALSRLNLSPDECIAIEDSNQGLLSATGAGLVTVITINQYTKHQNFDQAHLVINHLGEENLPFKVIKGNSYGESYFNLTLANSLLNQRIINDE